MHVNNKFKIGDTVSMVSKPENQGMITCIFVYSETHIEYQVSFDINVFDSFKEFELELIATLEDDSVK